MNKKSFLISVLIFCFVGILFFYFADIRFVADFKVNRLIKNTLINLFCAVIIIILVIYNDKRAISFYKVKGACFLILPFLVAVVNFPFSALITANAKITHYGFIPILMLNCLLIGLTEELLFRIIINGFIKEKISYQKHYIIYIVVASGVFALFHFFNLIGGADIVSTLIQVGYTFLLGAMFTLLYEKMYNIWICVIIHALFDFGGQIIPYLGFGNFQDLTFWILTMVIVVATFIQMVIYLYRKRKTL